MPEAFGLHENCNITCATQKSIVGSSCGDDDWNSHVLSNLAGEIFPGERFGARDADDGRGLVDLDPEVGRQRGLELLAMLREGPLPKGACHRGFQAAAPFKAPSPPPKRAGTEAAPPRKGPAPPPKKASTEVLPKAPPKAAAEVPTRTLRDLPQVPKPAKVHGCCGMVRQYSKLCLVADVCEWTGMDRLPTRKPHILRQYMTCKKLGSGALGVVFAVSLQNEELALKVMHQPTIMSRGRAHFLQQEISVCKTLQDNKCASAATGHGIVELAGCST
eukprot:s968_g2.t1